MKKSGKTVSVQSIQDHLAEPGLVGRSGKEWAKDLGW